MKDTFEDNKIAGVIHDKDSLISFFDENVLEVLLKDNDAFINSEELILEETEVSSSNMEVIVFKLSGREYAFGIESVAEIIDIVDSTNVAYTDKIIDGIINIRGQIVTIVSLFERLNIESNINEESKIIVCNINESKIGFIVDSVSDILDIKENELRVQDDELFTHVFHLDDGKRLVLSMDINKIISNKDI